MTLKSISFSNSFSTEIPKNFNPIDRKDNIKEKNILSDIKRQRNYSILRTIISLLCLPLIIGISIYIFRVAPPNENLIKVIGVIDSIACSFFFIASALDSYKALKVLKNIRNEKKDFTKLNALILLPTSDHNGAFTNKVRILYPLLKKYNLFPHYISSIKEINELLSERKYSLLFINGHGTKNSIAFTNKFTLKTHDVREINFANLKNNSIIALNSCSTGKDQGIGEEISKKSNKIVFAPKRSKRLSKISYSKDGNIEFQYKQYNFDYTRKILPSEESSSIFKKGLFQRVWNIFSLAS